MKQIWIICKKELNSFFNSLMAYIIIIFFLGFSGLFTWLSQNDVFLINQASLNQFFGISYWTLFFFIPAITMGLIAEESRSGTIELLVTKPVTDWQVVVGKYLAGFLLIVVSLALTFIYYITVSNIGKIDHGAVWAGYLGLLLMSSAYLGIGLFVSSLTTNQIVSFFSALFIGIFFHLIFGMLSMNFTGFLGSLLNYLSINTHFESISRGVIDSRDVIFFLSITFIGLFLTEINLAKRILKD